MLLFINKSDLIKNRLNIIFVIFLLLLFATNLKAQTESKIKFDHQIDSLNRIVLSDTLSKEQLAHTYIKIAKRQEQLDNTNESINQYNKALEIFNETNDYLNKIKISIELGVINHKQNKFDKALEFFFSANDILPLAKTQLSDDEYNLYHGIILLDISIIFGEVKYYETALQYAKEADGFMSNLDSTYIASSSSNLGTIYLGLHQLKDAQQYLNKAIGYFSTNDVDNYALAIIYKNLGSTYLEEKDYTQALLYFDKALEFHNQHPNLYMSERAGILAEIAIIHAENGEINEAQNNLELALTLSNNKKGNRYVEDIYESLVELYTSMNNSEKALESLKELSTIRDSLYNHKVMENIINIQKKYDQKRIKEANDSKIQILEQEKTIIQYKWYVLSGVLLILVLIMLLLFIRLRYNNNLNKIELKNVKLKQDQLASKLHFKNQELTNFAMYIVKKNEILEKIRIQINQLSSKSDPQINQLSTFINQHLDSFSDNKEFELRIENEYQDFYYKLGTLFPDLTEKDKKLCSLLLLDLSSKDIASLLNIESSSVDKSRYRLRKKMEIESDITFSSYLKNL